MIGAITGDIVGSIYEFNNHRSKEFKFLTEKNFFTDDTVMTIAIAKALMDSDKDYKNLGKMAIRNMQEFGRRYPHSGYGGMFGEWIFSPSPKPYNSFGNGAAMRVSPCGYVAKSLDEAILLSRKVTEVTHNHEEGIKGAEAVAVCIYLARTGKSIEEIKEYVNSNYYKIDFTLNDIRDTYRFNETCQDTVPQALEAFFESTSFEDAIRNAISIGGDSDTLAAITGGIAEAYYGIPKSLKNDVLSYLDDYLFNTELKFYGRIKRAF